ncbi:MAG: hypothetical protein ABSD20_11555 [Terriglobales bacterium]|jgi:hypothetical protein
MATFDGNLGNVPGAGAFAHGFTRKGTERKARHLLSATSQARAAVSIRQRMKNDASGAGKNNMPIKMLT